MFSISSVATYAVLLFACVRNVLALPEQVKRTLPAEPTGVKTIKSPNGVEIRYKEPGKDGVCETTPGVNSYSGYVSLNESTNMFFWFFEARHNPATAPITLWLNGGPGSDSMIGLFQELGPCSVTEDLKSKLNPNAFNEVSNMLFLSQPVGVGFSYAAKKVGYENENNRILDHIIPGVTSNDSGRYSYVAPSRTDTTKKAAVGAWEILQGFLGALPTLDSTVTNLTFNLWTESYGGQYGPVFYDYFYQQNELISSGQQEGVPLRMDTLGIINGIIDYKIQGPYYPEFAVNNTYGIKAVNDTIYTFMKTAYYIPGGCSDYIEYCRSSDKTTEPGKRTCQSADNICRGFVEVPYYAIGKRGVYDVRHPIDDPTPPQYFVDYLNLASTQQALGVDLNYTHDFSRPVGRGFFMAGDEIYGDSIASLERILNNGVRVALIYGDADYICNWFGGEELSLQVKYEHAKEFRASGYVPFVVDGTEYGEGRQYGNFSFTRIYESGHEVPYYQPVASLELFRRVLGNLVVSDGSKAVTPDYETEGEAQATHTESFVPLPSSSSSAAASSSGAAIF